MTARHRQVVGVEQADDEIVVHYRLDLRPLLSYLVWAVMIALVLGVALGCERDRDGLYQGPHDDFPQYRSVPHRPGA